MDAFGPVAGRRFRPAALLTLLLLPAPLVAQSVTTGAIAGNVKDTTGAVLPGVTVEAASPALIEKTRSVVSDDKGEYKIVNLRPGTYSVTFSLTGFSAVKREGIELTTGFTATVNGDLKVGSLAETVTVSGASPIVDTQNVRKQTVLSRGELDTLPSGKSVQAFAALTLGATSLGTQQDVGGDRGEGAASWGIHGANSGESRMVLDGMFISTFAAGSPGGRTVEINQMAIQEVTVSTRGISAEAEAGGPLINQVPKDGSNKLSVSFIGNGTSSGLQSHALTPELISKGLTSAASIKKVYDVGMGIGGPIIKDKLWFFQADRWWGAQNYIPGNYFADKTTPAAYGGLIYVPDLTQPAYLDTPNADWSGRLTWQVSAKQKAAFYGYYQHICNCYFQADNNRAPEAAPLINYRPFVGQGTWNYTATGKLLFEAGFSGVYGNDFNVFPPNTGPNSIPVVNLSTGYAYNALGNLATNVGPGSFTLNGTFFNNNLSQRASMTYVTGSHALKVGFIALEGEQNYDYKSSPVIYEFLNNRPAAVQQWSTPMAYVEWARNLGIYAQDQWTRSKLTLNLGLRLDWANAYNDAAQLPAGPFVPARNFPANSDVPNFWDVNPRLGAAYDLFGNGKTALKFAIGRYELAQTYQIAGANIPAYRIATNATRTWTDPNFPNDVVNGQVTPACDLTNPLANGQCGALNNQAFGQTIPVTSYANDALNGFGNRPFMWQTDASIQHELRPNLAVSAGYYRTWYGNLTITNNLSVTPANFSPFCVTTPVDPRLPGGGGQQVCGFYDVNPAQFGKVQNVVTQASNFGTMSQVYNGMDVALRARFGQGGLIQGGMATGQTTFGNCLTGLGATPQAPEPGTVNRFLPATLCQTTLPFAGQTQYKASGIYPLPWYGVQVSGTYQNLAGIPDQATWNAPNAVIAPSLGRNLAAGAAGTATVDLLVPNTQFEKRLNQTDVRITKILKIGRSRLQANVDVYNVFNARTILAETTTYGPNWLKPTAVLGGRVLKFGGQMDW